MSRPVEFQDLMNAMMDLKEHGRSRVYYLEGEAGIGKTQVKHLLVSGFSWDSSMPFLLSVCVPGF